ncbi:MAG: hypothetical protein ACFFDN_04605 [Candidatus Hodarchaeota archaeon]
MEIRSQIPDKLHIERSVFEQFIDHTFRFSDNEWGGLLIGRIINGELHCIAAVLPPQKTQSSGYCEFRREIFPVIRNALDDIEEAYNDENFNIITWIHTHPDIGVFLSPTDQDTYRYLSKLNPSLSAIVVDPVQYEILAVNSKPGNISGFTSFIPNLNYLHNFNEPNQILIEKLKLLQQRINSEKNRKLFKLGESEKIEVFIPISIETLKHRLIISSLNDLKINLQKITKNIFHQKPDIKIQIPEEENPEIRKIIEYLSHFREFRQEFKQWNRFSMNIKLYESNLYNISKYNPNIPLDSIIDKLANLGDFLSITPIYQISLWDKFLQYQLGNKSMRIKWSSIQKIGIDTLSKTNPLYVISYKTGTFSRWKRLLIFDFQFEQLKAILKSKALICFNENTKLRKKFLQFNRKIREEKMKTVVDQEKKRKDLEKKIKIEDKEEKIKNNKNMKNNKSKNQKMS